MMSDMYLRIKQVTVLTGLSRATIYNMMADGSFPMKTALGVRAVGWLSSEIEVWMAERKLVEKQGREAAPAKRKAAIPRRLPEVVPARSAPPTMAQNVGSKNLHGWEDTDDAAPTPAEADMIRNRLRLLKATKSVQGSASKGMTSNTSALSKRKRLATSPEPQVGEHAVGNVLDNDKT